MSMWFTYFSNMKTISEETGAEDSATTIRARAQGS